MLKPQGFPIGTKRLPLDTNYYETFNRQDVTLVDLKRTPVAELTGPLEEHLAVEPAHAGQP
jgi:cation diffusion facilitator CzcD-associated flavoprotein CzcO